jgi:hypothetical protein
MPNGTTIKSSHTCNLLLTALSPQARQAHILPGYVPYFWALTEARVEEVED